MTSSERFVICLVSGAMFGVLAGYVASRVVPMVPADSEASSTATTSSTK